MTRLSRRACLHRLSSAISAGAAANLLTHATEVSAPTLAANEINAIEAIANEIMTRGEIPGLSVAFAHAGQIAYSTGFGLADRAKGEKVTPAHRFRIASVSKPLTSAAIWTLIEQGKLKLEDKVFGSGGHLESYSLDATQAGITDITLHHLLTHTCGGWSNRGRDPMFLHPEMNHRDLIVWTLKNMPLENPPGKAYAYSNFGYCVLGRVLEKVTGKTYTDYVQHILTPCGITGMRIAGGALVNRQPNEVVYYGQGREDPYRAAMNIPRMDSHGGWLATAEDLVRFLIHVDGFPAPTDLLNASSIKTMTTGTSANPAYACGWAINSVPNWWHGGSLPGTSTLIVRTASGMCWAALANTRVKNDKTPGKDTGALLDRMMWRMARAVPAWKA